MRFMEWVLLISILIIGIPLFYKQVQFSKRTFKWWVLIVLLLTISQIYFEGLRWQMYPLYFVSIAMPLFIFFWNKEKFPTNAIRIIYLLSIVVTILSVSLLPLPELPTPTGDYAVGTTEYYFIDENRKEIYGSDPEMQRELMVQVWYPVEQDNSGEYYPWMNEMAYFSPEIGERFGIPGFMLEHLIYVDSNSFYDVPLAENTDNYPVILFSHGWLGFKEQNIYQVEELASHGYIVVGINHTYGAMMTVFPDGRSFARNRDALPEGVSDEAYYVASNKLVRQWADDLDFIVDELSILNNDPTSLFFNNIKLEKIGVMGHSTGGGAAIEFCFENPICGALLGMDTWLEPVSNEKLESGHGEPMLLMFSDSWASVPEDEGNKPFVEILVRNADSWVSEMVIADTMHFDFSITPVISPLTELLGFKGSLDGDRILEIINTYSVDFFNQFLKSMNSNLLEGNDLNFPEVLFSGK